MTTDKRFKTRKLAAEARSVGLIYIGSAASGNKNKKQYEFQACAHRQDIGVKEVREDRFRCQTCLNNKLSNEAASQGLTLIGEAINKQHRTYQFNKCRHIQEIATGNVRKGGKHVGCAACRAEKLQKEAKRAGTVILGAGTSAHYRRYYIKACGHEVNLKTQSVRNGLINCTICKESRFTNEAKAAGLTLLGEASHDLDVLIRPSNYRLFRVNECGHEQNFKLTHVRDGQYSCRICSLDNLEQRAFFSGYELIEKNKKAAISEVKCLKKGHISKITTYRLGRGKVQCIACFDDNLEVEANSANLTFKGQANRNLFDANYRLYSCNRCKCDLTLRIEHVRKKSFLCENCDESHLDFPSAVYLLKITCQNFSWIKLGYSSNLVSRIAAYGLRSECHTEVVKMIHFDTGRKAKDFELSLHRSNKHVRLKAEKMKHYHRLNGHTECYEASALTSLISMIKAQDSQFDQQVRND